MSLKQFYKTVIKSVKVQVYAKSSILQTISNYLNRRNLTLTLSLNKLNISVHRYYVYLQNWAEIAILRISKILTYYRLPGN